MSTQFKLCKKHDLKFPRACPDCGVSTKATIPEIILARGDEKEIAELGRVLEPHGLVLKSYMLRRI